MSLVKSKPKRLFQLQFIIGILFLYRATHLVHHFAASGAAGVMVEEHVYTLTHGTGIDVQHEQSLVRNAFGLVLLIHFVHLARTLHQAPFLIQRHLGAVKVHLVLIALEVFAIADAIVRILRHQMHGSAFRHKLTRQPKRDVIGIFVLAKAMPVILALCARIRCYLVFIIEN